MRITDGDLLAVLRNVWDHPEDWALRCIAADAAEDAGMADLAACLRWMAEKGRYPDYIAVRIDRPWTWWWKDGGMRDYPEHSMLPNVIIKDFPRPQIYFYSTCQMAEETLYRWFSAAVKEKPEEFA